MHKNTLHVKTSCMEITKIAVVTRSREMKIVRSEFLCAFLL